MLITHFLIVREVNAVKKEERKNIDDYYKRIGVRTEAIWHFQRTPYKRKM